MNRSVMAILCGVLTLLAPGCLAPSSRLSFPSPMEAGPGGRVYDVNADARADFRLAPGAGGRLDVLEYDDDEDGTPDRVFRLSEYADDEAPHLIILLDSIPFGAVRERYESGGWTWFDPPVKVIPPFPTMSPVIFSRMLHAPPLAGVINQHYDRASGRHVNRILERVEGAGNPWELRLHYRLRYWRNGLAFLSPRRWFQAELVNVKRALDASPDRVTIVYLASTACMLSKYGRPGLDEVLDGLDRLCMELLYERHGAIKISVLADHGHNLIHGSRCDIREVLRDAGFRPVKRLSRPDDVVVELDGLVNYAGLYTKRPAGVAAAIVARREFSLAMYMEGDGVVVRDAGGKARVERRGDRFRYSPVGGDPLGYGSVIERLRAEGKVDAEGFIADRDWFEATVDLRYPDGPRRAWDAFHGLVVSTPDVMVCTAPGFFVGLASMQWFIDMQSTHGGFDQTDSATFLLTMTGRAKGPVRTGDVLPMFEPSFNPDHRPARGR